MTGERSAAGRLTDEAVTPVASATVLLVRDDQVGTGQRGIEVLLLERHLASDFAGGAYAFPGGKVGPEDQELAPERWRGAALASWRERLGVDADAEALGYLVAAVRETFEEVGVLLAVRADGTTIGPQELTSPSFREARARLAARGEPWDWRPWLVAEDLVLDLDALALWSWWVTPEGQHKRFDTRFFIAAAPPQQVADHDRIEATDSVWTSPQDALAAQHRGEVTIIFPTRRNLETLARFPSSEAAIAAARAGEIDQRRVVPRLVRVDGRTLVQHPFEDAPSEL